MLVVKSIHSAAFQSELDQHRIVIRKGAERTARSSIILYTGAGFMTRFSATPAPYNADI
jgi:hypothetical protein